MSFASLGLAGATAAICAYYLLVGFGYSSDPSGSVSLAWNARVAAAGASLQATLWGRRLIVLGLLSFLTYPFAESGQRTLLERLGLVSRDWKRAAVSWTFVASCSLLTLVAILNYYANAATFAIRSDILGMILFLDLSPLNSMIYDPVGMFGGEGEIAEWFAVFLVLTVASFFCLRVRLGIRNALLDSAAVLLGSLLLYEFGLVLLCSNFDYVRVTALQIGTPVQWFSNVDLLYLSALGLAGLVLARMTAKPRELTSVTG
ncbi:MAG: hypothetical protein OK456_11060 [Thaumarchaeota archaeon]|nr:hypothetical protein [Nitrososphaerota archaeon]